MSQNTRVTLLTAASVLALALPACNKHSARTETAKRAEKASGETVYKDATTATVEAIDLENRIVTLREEKGDLLTVEVGQGVPIDRMQAQDKVNVAYEESLAFTLQEPGSEPTVESEETSERLPDGVQFGRRVTTTVEILAVAPEGTEATFRNPEGEVRTVEVEDPQNQEKVSHLRPGDSVEVTYTEKLALELARDQDEDNPAKGKSQSKQKGKERRQR